jgi:hypothetical protein
MIDCRSLDDCRNICPGLKESGMPDEAMFAMELDAELRDQFIAEAKALDQPASQVLHQLVSDFVQRQREAREYEDFLRHKVEKARVSIRADLGRSREEVAGDFAARRQRLIKSDEA